MKSATRFSLGGLGALMPILIGLLSIDLVPILNDLATLTTGHYVGLALRYFLLFVVGGVVAALHTTEHQPFKLFELGIAAPALLTSVIATGSANLAPPPQNADGANGNSLFSWFLPAAHAKDSRDAYPTKTREPVRLAGGFGDVLDGLTGRYKNLEKARHGEVERRQRVESERARNAKVERAKRIALERARRAEVERTKRVERERSSKAEFERAKGSAQEQARNAEVGRGSRMERERQRKEISRLRAEIRKLLERIDKLQSTTKSD